jgi:hypothetical protein
VKVPSQHCPGSRDLKFFGRTHSGLFCLRTYSLFDNLLMPNGPGYLVELSCEIFDDVIEHKYADKLTVSVDHRHTSYSAFAHLLECESDARVLADRYEVAINHVANPYVSRIHLPGNEFDNDVAVGYRSDRRQAAIARLCHDQIADVRFTHHLSGAPGIFIVVDRSDVGIVNRLY